MTGSSEGIHEVLVASRNMASACGLYLSGNPDGSDNDDRYLCAQTAMWYAAEEIGAEAAIDGAYQAFADAIGVGGDGVPVAQIHAFHDEPGRRKSEVLATFDRAIAATAPPPIDPVGLGPGDIWPERLNARQRSEPTERGQRV